MSRAAPPPFLVGKQVRLRPVEMADAKGAYWRWLNDPETTRFLEVGQFPITRKALEETVRAIRHDSRTVFLAIMLQRTNVHVGNLKLGPIDWVHRHAPLGLIIGDKRFRGKGHGREAIELALQYAFGRLNLNKVTLGVSVDHKTAVHLYQRVGFKIEGRLRQHLFREGAYHDKFVMGLLRDEFWKRMSDGASRSSR